VTIALTFVPQLIIQIEAIRDAQRMRGHRFRAWRDGLLLLVPLLAGGLERSLQLAEAMDSRGYGRTIQLRHNAVWGQLAVIGGLTLLSIGLYIGFVGDGGGFVAGGIGLIVAFGALRLLSGSAPHTRYLHERWRDRDTLVTLASLLMIGSMLVLRFVNVDGLTYTTLPRISLPPFSPLSGLLLMLLGAPAFLSLIDTEVHDERQHRL
jgi:energy-coupling factor transport system permease protein